MTPAPVAVAAPPTTAQDPRPDLRPEEALLRLLLSAAVFGVLAGLALAIFGVAEQRETQLWVVAFAIAVPAGYVLGGSAIRRLGPGPGGSAGAAVALAGGVWLLVLGLGILKAGRPDAAHHVVVAVMAGATLALPWLLARVAVPERARVPAAAAGVAAFLVLGLLFVLKAQRNVDTLAPAVALGLAATALVARAGTSRFRGRHLVDLAFGVLLVLTVAHFPDIRSGGGDVLHHQGFFLAPTNDVIHGRSMLNGSWSQYGVGMFDALRVVFKFIPIGYGGMGLLLAVITAAEFLWVYGTLRLAGTGVVVAVVAMAVAVIGQIFGQIESYTDFPSVGALRFGLPFVIVTAAVAGARWPARARLLSWAQLMLVGVAAVWSFETFIYSVAACGSICLVEELTAGHGWVRRVAGDVLRIVLVAAAAIALFSLATFLASGGVHWGPYIEYLRLYSVQGFGQLPVKWFSPGPVAGAAVFFSAAGLVWLARDRPSTIPAPMRPALAGFTGAAIAQFTYYLGRSDLNNVRHVLLPITAIVTLWVVVLLRDRRPTRAGMFAVTAILLTGGLIVAQAWPFVRQKWPISAAGLLVPLGHRAAGQPTSLGSALKLAWDQPLFDTRIPGALALIDRHFGKGQPVLLITEPSLTVELLMRADRRNLLPISDPMQDTLIASSEKRVLDAAARVPAGTLLLTTPPNPPMAPNIIGVPGDFTREDSGALALLRRRFAFRMVDNTVEGVQLMRLDPRG
jgi:hypothetical protein